MMPSSFANLTTMSDYDLMELVWENGKILTRGTSGRTQRLNSHDSLQNYRSKSLANWCETEYDEIFEHYRSNSFNKNLTDTQIVPVHENSNPKAPCSSHSNRSLPQFMVSEENPSRAAGSDKTMEKVNFPMFAGPEALIKANNSQEATRRLSNLGLLRDEGARSKKQEAVPGSGNPIESTLIETANGSKRTANHQNQQNPMNKMEMVLPNAKHVQESPPDERSAAVGRSTEPFWRLPVKKKMGTGDVGRSAEPLVASSSACSRGASNDPTYALKRKYEETEGSVNLSDNFEEESEDVMRQVPARTSKGAKGKRTTEVHNLSERRRRDKINKKMRALQELIPSCNKVDKASMLDEAIEYLKTLQLQVQMMSMGNGFCGPTMMLPLGMQQINTLRLAHCSPMGFGLGMGMHMGMQFIPSGATSLSGIGDARHMLGFPGQAMPMPMSHSQFLSFFKGSSTQSVLGVPSVSEAAVPNQLQKSASMLNFNEAIRYASLNDPTHNQERMNNPDAKFSNIPIFSQAENENIKHFAPVQEKD